MLLCLSILFNFFTVIKYPEKIKLDKKEFILATFLGGYYGGKDMTAET